MAGTGEFDFFRYEDCTLCGECLTRCQYIDFTEPEAVEEKQRLIEGEPTHKVLDECISCYACDAFCPNDCRPYELILSRWHRRYREKGLPVRASYLMPSSFPNFRTDVVKNMTYRERHLLRVWRETPPEGEVVLYPGCNLLTIPHLVDAGFMHGVTISGDWELCCGEMFFRMGLFDAVRQQAEKLSEYYQGRDIGKMLFVCPACMNMFRNVLPGQFGAEFAFETEFITNYFLDKISGGDIEIPNKLDGTITVHDSCHGRIIGDEVMESSRLLFSLMGLEIREMEHNRLEGYCCGAAAGCNRYSPFDIVFAGGKELWEAQKTGARELALYCTGCNITLEVCRWVLPTTQPIRHLLEYMKEASGEEVDHLARGRALHMILNLVLKAFPKLLSHRTYRVEA